MKKAKPLLLFRPHLQADERFYDGYDPKFISNKAWLLFHACEHPEALKTFVSAVGGKPDDVDTEILQSLVAELHFAVLHQFEVLFALMLGQFQPLPHWVFLTEYKTAEIVKKAQSYVSGEYRAASNDLCSTQAEFVSGSVYPGVNPPGELEPALSKSIDDIGWLIEEGAKRYLSSPEYNAYKHGLRVLPGAMTLMVRLREKNSEFAPVMSMSSSITYLEREDVEDGRGYAEVTKEVKAADAFNWIFAMASIAEIIKTIRLARIRQTPVKISTMAIDRDGLTRLRPTSKFRVSL
jgi:hypothetical protein